MIREEFEQKNDGYPYKESDYILWLEKKLIEARQERNIAIAILNHCLPGWTEMTQVIINEMQKEYTKK
jgi:hypothetical protein